MTHSFVRLAAAAAVFVGAQAHAATTLFDFENQPFGTETPFVITTAGLTASFAGPSATDPGAFGISTNFPSPTGFQYRLMTGDFLTVGSAFGATGAALTITFSAPVTAFSVNFGLDDTANTTQISFATNAGGTLQASGTLVSGFHYPEGTLSFSGSAFTQLTVSSNAIDFQLDNLQVMTAPVPEPSAAWLLVAGIPMVLLLRRRGNDKR